jgi:hypothetical protein
VIPTDGFDLHSAEAESAVALDRHNRLAAGDCGADRVAAGYELREEPHALRLARLTLREEPERSVHVQVSARRPHQQRVGIFDEARQRRHPEPLPHRGDLRLVVGGVIRRSIGTPVAAVASL